LPAGAVAFRDGRVQFDGGEVLGLRPVAGRQLRRLAARALGRPVASGDDIRRALALRGDRRVLVRVEGDAVRAILGTNFTPLDDSDILGRLARAVAAVGWKRTLRVRFIAESEAITVVRATLATSRVELRGSDAFERGFEAMNSEVGAAAFSIRPIVFRA